MLDRNKPNYIVILIQRNEKNTDKTCINIGLGVLTSSLSREGRREEGNEGRKEGRKEVGKEERRKVRKKGRCEGGRKGRREE